MRGPELRRWVLVAALAAGTAVAGCGTAPPPSAAGGATTSATAVAPPTGPADPTATGTGPTRRAAPADAGGGGVPLDTPLPDEGERSPSSETTDWATENGTDRTWLLDPCSPTAYPTDAARTGFKTVSRTGPEFSEARQLAAYPSPEVATEAVEGFRRALTACSTGTTPDGSRWEWVTREEPGLGDDGLLAASTVGGPGFSPAGDRVAVTRVGSTVFLAFSSGESSAAEIDGAADEVRRVAQQFLDSL
jgi:hypothetical protein